MDLAKALANRWEPTPWRGPGERPSASADPRDVWNALAPLRDPAWSPLFHLHRSHRRMRSKLGHVALRTNPSLEIPAAHFASCPLTAYDAALFSTHADRAREAELLACEAARRLDLVGGPTAGSFETPDPMRRAGWTVRTRARQCERTTLLLTSLLLDQLDPRPPAIVSVLGGHQFTTSYWARIPIATIAIGAIAWDTSCERSLTLGDKPDRCGAKLYPRVAGRPLGALPNPFEPLIALLDLGVEIASIGDQAVAIFRSP